MSEFFQMGGYAFYVWMSYGLTLLVLIANIIAPWQHQRELLKMITRRVRRNQRHAHHDDEKA